MDSPLVLLIPVFVAFVVLSLVWHFGRSQSLLEKWADANGYHIIHKQYRNFFRGPFFWTASKGQTVYYVTVQDKAGWTRSGWVRCGGWWLGLLSDQVEVRWYEASPMR